MAIPRPHRGAYTKRRPAPLCPTQPAALDLPLVVPSPVEASSPQQGPRPSAAVAERFLFPDTSGLPLLPIYVTEVSAPSRRRSPDEREDGLRQAFSRLWREALVLLPAKLCSPPLIAPPLSFVRHGNRDCVRVA
eukprot:RCo028213